jgi:hypothetical protein
MIRTILSIAILTTVVSVAPLKADPTPAPKKDQKQTTTKTSAKTPKVAPVAPTKEGWSLVNGVWTHSDGYKFVNNQVMRVGTQTHKKPPKPPTKAEMEAATKKTAPKSVDPAAAKAAERERNLAPRPAPQTGTHL